MMNELVKISFADGTTPTVSARDLHEALQIKTKFKDWFPRMVEYGFEESRDFNPLIFEQVRSEGDREVKREIKDYSISIDMAKQVCMLQRSELGRQYRQYFIDLEKAWNSPDQVYARALAMAERQRQQFQVMAEDLQRKLLDARPKIEFADAVSGSDSSILIGDLAKLLRQNGLDIGQNRLFSRLRDEGFLMKSGCRRNLPSQKAMDQGLFEIVERIISLPDGSTRITRTTKVTGKGQQYFLKHFLKKKSEVAKK